MRQAKDQRLANLLSRVHRRCPTDEDLALLYSRVGAPLPSSVLSPLAIVRRNKLRHAINSERLQQMAALNGDEIVYCTAKVLDKAKDMKNSSLNAIYSIRQSSKPRHEDAVLALIPGAPLLITQNIDSSLGLVHGASSNSMDLSGIKSRLETIASLIPLNTCWCNFEMALRVSSDSLVSVKASS